MVTADGAAASLIAVFAMAPNNYKEQIMEGYAVFVKFEKFIFYLAVDWGSVHQCPVNHITFGFQSIIVPRKQLSLFDSNIKHDWNNNKRHCVSILPPALHVLLISQSV